MAVVGSLSPLQIIIYYWILVQLRVQITIILLRKTANLAATVTALTPVVSAVVVLLQGMRITPLLRPWSTTTKIESNPFTRGKSVMKSIEQYANGRVDFAPSVGMNAGLDGCLSILNCWQTPHPLT